MKKKLCQVSTLLPPERDGVADGVIRIQSLFDERHETTYIISSSDQKKDKKGVFAMIEKWSSSSWLKILKVLRNNDISIILLHYPSPRYYRYISISFLPLFLRIFGVKTVLYMHEYIDFSKLGRLRIRLLALFSHKVITTDTPNYLISKKNILFSKKTFLLPVCSNFPDIANELPYTQDQQITDSSRKLQIAYFGLIRSGKNLEHLLDIFISGKFSNHFNLHIFGDVSINAGPKDKKLYERVKQEMAWQYHGYLPYEELLNFFKRIDVVVLPYVGGVSERRGSFMFSVSLGKAVLTTAPTYSIQELSDDHNVLFINGEGVQAMEQAIERITSYDSNRLSEIGRNARKWYLSNYGGQVFISKLYSIIFN